MVASASTQPYLLRALYDWAVDNGYTPNLVVNANAAGVSVPPGHARDGKITLNIHPQAVHGLELGNEWILFSARFGGRSVDVQVPVAAVLAIYARENGQGLAFQAEPAETGGEAPAATGPEPPPQAPPPKGRPRLKRIK